MKCVLDNAFGPPAAAVLALISLLPACPGAQYRVDKVEDAGGPQGAWLGEPEQATMDDAGTPNARAYTGLISVQDMAIANLPDAGHGPSVSIAFTEARAPDFEEQPGQPTGCKVWSYERPAHAAAPPTAQGIVTIQGLARGSVRCSFEPSRGYACAGASFPFSALDTAGPEGVFAAGPGVVVGIEPGGVAAIDFPDLGPVTPGGAFQLDPASHARIAHVPLDGSELTLACASGTSCSPAAATVIRISTTDGDTRGLPIFAMPPPASRQVEIQCASLATAGTLTVPENVMRYLAVAHAASPMTRVRTAYMREGFAFGNNPAPLPPTTVTLLVGHGILGFTDP